MSDTQDLNEAWYSHAAAVEQKLGTMAEMFSQIVTSLNAQIDTDRDVRASAISSAVQLYAGVVSSGGKVNTGHVLRFAADIADYIKTGAR